MSCGPGAISATISLPSMLVLRTVAAILVGAAVLPAPAAVVPIVGAPHAGGVDHRNALLMRLLDQRFQIGHRHPGVLAAGVAPALDRFQDRHRPLVAECVVDVDDEQRRTLAEALARAVAGRSEHRLVALGEKLVPDRFRHFCSLPMPRRSRRLEQLSQARVHALDEAHVDDFVILDVGLENAGVHHHGLAGVPGLRG